MDDRLKDGLRVWRKAQDAWSNGPFGDFDGPNEAASIITDALAEKDARSVAQAAEITMLRQLLDDVRLEASETIPPDGKAAAFVALHQICFMISTRAALENTNDKV